MRRGAEAWAAAPRYSSWNQITARQGKAGFWGYWALVETGIYFVNTESAAQPTLQFLSFDKRDVLRVARLDRKPIPYESGIAVSPDHRWILYTQEDQRSSDIMLVEDFR